MAGSPDLIVVGSGFFGTTIAERVANVLNRDVLVIEKRPHIGGNAYSFTHAESEIEVHKYGMHIFHTSNKRVIEYISQFTEFNNYRHKVVSRHKGALYSLPINLTTMRQIYGENLTPDAARQRIQIEIADSGVLSRDPEANLKEKAISLVGPTIYEALIKGYSKKQWQRDPEDLPASTVNRLPVRFNTDENYFFDDFQGIPIDGYGSIFNKMLGHSRISVITDTDFFETPWAKGTHVPVVYTGPIDRYFDYRFGQLNWRTLDFETDLHPVADFQGHAVINEADEEIPWTRTLEFRHLQIHRRFTKNLTIVTREYSRTAEKGDEPYYPVNTETDRQLLQRYRELAEVERNTVFGGRLGSYQYLDMHMAIASALTTFENNIAPRFR